MTDLLKFSSELQKQALSLAAELSEERGKRILIQRFASSSNFICSDNLLMGIESILNSDLTKEEPSIFLLFGMALSQYFNKHEALTLRKFLMHLGATPQINPSNLSNHLLWTLPTINSDNDALTCAWNEVVLAFILNSSHYSMTVFNKEIHVSLTCPQPEHLHDIISSLPCPVKFNQTVSAIYLPSEALNFPILPIHSSSQSKSSATSSVNSNTSTSITAEHIVQLQCINVFLQNLEQPMSQAELASHLRLSERTLKRRLTVMGTNYQTLLSDLRLDRAAYLLAVRRLNVTQTAHEMGYSSTANFSKAFKKWCGQSPGRVRIKGIPTNERLNRCSELNKAL
ncbi:MAG: AraC family transcriptional regulator [Oleibacter sp.]|nr:AraC family transcriptional regulator [Thalassolituus sp.]